MGKFFSYKAFVKPSLKVGFVYDGNGGTADAKKLAKLPVLGRKLL